MKLAPFKYALLAPGVIYVYGKGTEIKSGFRLLSKERDNGYSTMWRIVSLRGDKNPFFFRIYKSWEQESRGILLALPDPVTLEDLL